MRVIGFCVGLIGLGAFANTANALVDECWFIFDRAPLVETSVSPDTVDVGALSIESSEAGVTLFVRGIEEDSNPLTIAFVREVQ